MNPKLEPFRILFESKVEIDLATSCWNWKGCSLNNGYGQMYVGGKMLLAHRVSYALYKGEGKVSDDWLVCHSCDNRKCVNPEHLWLGTHYDNIMDSIAKGRQVECQAKMHEARKKKVRKFTPEQIRAMRTSTKSVKEIAKEYGVDTHTVYKILYRESYKDVS